MMETLGMINGPVVWVEYFLSLSVCISTELFHLHIHIMVGFLISNSYFARMV